MTTRTVRSCDACGRELRSFYDDVPRSAESSDVIELRAEIPRGWCLRCAFWAAYAALGLTERGFRRFVDRVQAGEWP